MQHWDKDSLVISASRTKDMVHRSPALLADILLGKAPCRWGPHGPFGSVDPSKIHTVVLWTKDPHNLLHHPGLRESLLHLIKRHHVQVSLQITATGLGGSFIEPGIPRWEEVVSDLSNLLSEGWTSPAAVVYRYDPFLTVRRLEGQTLSNANMAVFERICSKFVHLGIPRVTTSRADVIHYARVAQRIRSLGLEWVFIEDDVAFRLCQQMDSFCRSGGAEFSICCDPHIEPLLNRWGCIDARWLNSIKGGQFPGTTEILHNQIGKQRPDCKCTYSRDIGYSPGSATCYSGGYGCLYCYSQGNAGVPEIKGIIAEMREFDRNPEGYLSSRDLPMELCTIPE